MLYCEQCKVNVGGCGTTCPLCGEDLVGTPEEHSCYPQIVPKKQHLKRVIAIISIVGAAISAICLLINLLIPTEVFWALFVVFGTLCSWLWTVIWILKRSVVINNIVWQCLIISSCAFLWDYFTGKHGWSVDFVFPCLCCSAMAAIVILSKAMRMPGKEYVINLMVCAILGVVPLVFLLTDLVTIKLPSILCVGIAGINILLQLIINWKTVTHETAKKLHL